MNAPYWLVGVAGHIDHGKTTLTKALTGIDTDRLKEEKERQISIEPGYAHLTLPSGKRVGFVDVPGHERFIRQMVAGVVGIDVALLVVAADEGVMPQTREHLAILELLGIKRGLVALTKTDIVDADMLALAREDVAATVAGTFLAGAPIVPVSAVTGAGLDALVAALDGVLDEPPDRPLHGPARLPVDRAFARKGFGTVVTGTLFQGTVRPGNELVVLPKGRRVRVRGIHVHGEPQEAAVAGQRTALNLVGIEAAEVRRGDVVATPGAFTPTDRLDVALRLLPDAAPLKQRAPIRLFVGTADVLGRIVFFDRNTAQPGDEALCQLVLDEPVVAARGDRFILRRPSPPLTLGGGEVLDPHAPKHRFGPATIALLEKKRQGDPAQQLLWLLEEAGALPAQEVANRINLPLDAVQDHAARLAADGQVRLLAASGQESDPLLVSAAAWAQWRERAQDELARYHRERPLLAGMAKAALHSRVLPNVDAKAWDALCAAWEEEGWLRKDGELVALASFAPHVPERLKPLVDGLLAEWEQAGLHAPDWRALCRVHHLAERDAEDLRTYLLASGQAQPLDNDRIVPSAAVRDALRALWNTTGQQGRFTIQEARDILGLSRKTLIPLLELADRLGYTRREEAVRVWVKEPG
ncbi:selenocysteine-specific translation elongation factor [Calditerricola yamamurae]|jgi:selenocysteine-specific elongation factor SelB